MWFPQQRQWRNPLICRGPSEPLSVTNSMAGGKPYNRNARGDGSHDGRREGDVLVGNLFLVI